MPLGSPSRDQRVAERQCLDAHGNMIAVRTGSKGSANHALGRGSAAG
jgi:hypothetical protein